MFEKPSLPRYRSSSYVIKAAGTSYRYQKAVKFQVAQLLSWGKYIVSRPDSTPKRREAANSRLQQVQKSTRLERTALPRGQIVLYSVFFVIFIKMKPRHRQVLHLAGFVALLRTTGVSCFIIDLDLSDKNFLTNEPRNKRKSTEEGGGAIPPQSVCIGGDHRCKRVDHLATRA